MSSRKVAFDAKTFLARIGAGRTIAKYRKDAVIFAQGDPADAVFYVQTGRVKLTIVSGQGKEAVVGIYSATDFFGEASLAGQPLRIATATTISECHILRLVKSAMIRMLHDELAFSEFFVALLNDLYVIFHNIKAPFRHLKHRMF